MDQKDYLKFKIQGQKRKISKFFVLNSQLIHFITKQRKSNHNLRFKFGINFWYCLLE